MWCFSVTEKLWITFYSSTVSAACLSNIWSIFLGWTKENSLNGQNLLKRYYKINHKISYFLDLKERLEVLVFACVSLLVGVMLFSLIKSSRKLLNQSSWSLNIFKADLTWGWVKILKWENNESKNDFSLKDLLSGRLGTFILRGCLLDFLTKFLGYITKHGQSNINHPEIWKLLLGIKYFSSYLLLFSFICSQISLNISIILSMLVLIKAMVLSMSVPTLSSNLSLTVKQGSRDFSDKLLFF